MKCQYCGKDLAEGSKFCDGCGSKIEVEESKPSQQPVTVPVNDNSNNQSYSNQFNSKPPKKSNAWIIVIVVIVAIIVLLVGAILAGVFLFGHVSKSVEDKYNEVSEKEKEDDNDKEDDGNEDSGSDQKIDMSNETVQFENYTLTIPTGFVHGTATGKDYIQNSDCGLMYMKYPMSYQQIVSMKDVLMSSFEDQGFTVSSFDTKQINGINFVIMTGTLNNVQYAYMFCDLKGDMPIFFTICATDLGDIDTNWYNYVAQFVASAK